MPAEPSIIVRMFNGLWSRRGRHSDVFFITGEIGLSFYYVGHVLEIGLVKFCRNWLINIGVQYDASKLIFIHFDWNSIKMKRIDIIKLWLIEIKILTLIWFCLKIKFIILWFYKTKVNEWLIFRLQNSYCELNTAAILYKKFKSVK